MLFKNIIDAHVLKFLFHSVLRCWTKPPFEQPFLRSISSYPTEHLLHRPKHMKYLELIILHSKPKTNSNRIGCNHLGKYSWVIMNWKQTRSPTRITSVPNNTHWTSAVGPWIWRRTTRSEGLSQAAKNSVFSIILMVTGYVSPPFSFSILDLWFEKWLF